MHIDTPEGSTSEDNKTRIPSSNVEWNQLKEEIKNSFIPKNTIIESRPFEAEDFIGLLNNVESCFKKLTSVLSHIPPEEPSVCSKSRYECISYAIILCGEHSSKNVWTDDDCVALAHTTLKILMSSSMCETLNEYMIKVDHQDKLQGVNLFTFILPKLSKEEWKYYPAVTCCFAWLLSHIQVKYFS